MVRQKPRIEQAPPRIVDGMAMAVFVMRNRITMKIRSSTPNFHGNMTPCLTDRII